MEPEEVAEALQILYDSGKVKHFGVSNQNMMQIELLKKYVKQPLIFNQLQFSVTNTGMVDSGLYVNTVFDNAIDRDGSILEYSRINDMTIQAWSPFQYGYFEGIFLESPKYPELNGVMKTIAKEKGVSNTTIATAFILRHPANMQVICGTTKASRLRLIAAACDVKLSRKEWYEIYTSAGNVLP